MQMKKRTKIITSIVALLLCCVMLFIATMFSNPNGVSLSASTRTFELSVLPEYENYLADFDEKSVDYDEEYVSFYGKMKYDEQVLTLFDQIALAEDIDTEQSNIIYDCSFDMETMQFTFRAALVDENNEIQEIEEMVTDAFVTEYGQLDAYIELDGETYLLSDYVSTDVIDKCLFGWLKALIVIVVVIVVYVVVAETAEQIKAKSNYSYNKDLEANGKGVAKGLYITNQNYGTATISKYESEYYPSNYYPADYKFGFTTFGGVGCEVASVYNLLIELDKTEMLSETIYNFENWAIEYSIGWGYLGSSPKDIYRYLNKKYISYSKYTSYSKFKDALAKKDNCKVIMSSWNNGGMLKSVFSGEGLHTYYFKKTAANTKPFEAYNLTYSYESIFYSSIDEIYAKGGDFIVAYIIG